MKKKMSYLSIKARKPAWVVTKSKIWTQKNEHNMASSMASLNISFKKGKNEI